MAASTEAVLSRVAVSAAIPTEIASVVLHYAVGDTKT
jgi:hypothetical protein